jgi:hypothetical protein
LSHSDPAWRQYWPLQRPFSTLNFETLDLIEFL